MSQKVTFNPIKGLLRGFDIVANAVGGTLGPNGRNVYIKDAYQPEITNDGATIAQHITLKDPVEDLGAYIVKNTSSQTNDDVGDGTTTTAVLLQAIVHESVNRSESPIAIRNSLQQAESKILGLLKKKSIKITDEDIHRVALISTENQKIASTISDMIKQLGKDCAISVEDSQGIDIEWEGVSGYEANVGFMSPNFINEPKKSRAVFTDVPVLVTEKKIATISNIQRLFEQFKEKGINQCVIVCEDIADPILGLLVFNKVQGTFNSVVIRATGPLLHDIEAATGATRVSDVTGVTFEKIALNHLGKAKKLICDANKTLFVGDSLKSQVHADYLETAAKNEPNMFAAKKLKERAAKMRGKIGVLRIGAPTDTERVFLKRKAEDGIKAVPAALEEGIVEGGGIAFYNISQTIKPQTIGEEILKKALTSPLRKIVENSGKDFTDIIKQMPDGYGYDAKNNQYVEMINSGIIDPTKVERIALKNAISSASTFITTFATITDDPIK